MTEPKSAIERLEALAASFYKGAKEATELRAIIEELKQREERDIAERVDAETSHCLGPITGPTIDASGITLTDEDGTIHISMDEYKRMKKRDEAVRKVAEELSLCIYPGKRNVSDMQAWAARLREAVGDE